MESSTGAGVDYVTALANLRLDGWRSESSADQSSTRRGRMATSTGVKWLSYVGTASGGASLGDAMTAPILRISGGTTAIFAEKFLGIAISFQTRPTGYS